MGEFLEQILLKGIDHLKRKNVYIFPLVLLVVNIVLIAFLLEELMDETDPNYGTLSLLAPIFAIISMLYLRKFGEAKKTGFVRLLQGLNWIFIVFPIAVFLWMASLMLIS